MTRSLLLLSLFSFIASWMTTPVSGDIINDNFSSSSIDYNFVRVKESDIDGGWQANSNQQAGQGYPQSAWTISAGTLSNASPNNDSSGEGGVAQVISVTEDGTELVLSFDYTNSGNDTLYVHLWGFTGVLSGDDDNIGNYQANNGHYYNNAEDVDGVGNVNTYNLKDGSNPAGGSPANALAVLTGSGNYSITIPIATLGIAGVDSVGDFSYLSLAITRNVGSTPGSSGIDNLQLRAEPVAPPPPPPSPDPAQLRNYSYLYFENGYPTTFNTRRPQSEANLAARANPDLVFQTGYFSLLFDCNDIRLKGYDAQAGSDYRAALDEDVTRFTPAQNLLLRVYRDGVAYDCVSAVVAGNGFNNVRLIESGQYVQRIDHLGLVFKAANGDTLVTDPNCRLEITAWPDRVTLFLDFSEEIFNPVTRTTIRVISPNGTTHLADVMANQVRLSLKPQEDLKLGSLNASDYVTTATNLQNGSSLAVNFDADTHALHMDVPAASVSYPADADRIDEYLVEVTNPGSTTENIPLVFEQPIPRKITGTVMLLADETDGRPLGIPVQISKNWHRNANNPSPHEGPWLRGSTMLTMEPGETRRFKLRVIYGYWGGAGAVSHAQLSLIGWGGNWKWDESALGAWGESITFDPAQHIAGSFMGDIRPSFTDSYSANGPTYGWTENCGGADFLLYRDSTNTYRWGKRLKTCYHRTGPNMTEVIYGGVTDDERIRFTYTARAVSTHDYHRRFSKYRYEFLEDVTSPQRLVFHQMAADYYMVPSYTNYYLGDENGLLESRVIDAGGNTYKGTPIDFNGKWLSIDDTIGGGNPAKALRGLMSLSSTLNDAPLPVYLHTYGRTWGSSTMLFDLAGAAVTDSYNAGDVVAGELEFVMPPQHRDNYWGGDNELINRLTSYGDTAWEPVRDEWAHNAKLDISMQSGTLLRSYPLEIQPQSNDSVLADFTINSGGIGHLPVIIQGAAAGQELKVQRWNSGNWTDLEGVDLAGNAYYQGVTNPDGSMDYIFSIPRPSLDLNASWRVRIINADIVIPNDPPAFASDPITEIDGSASSPYESSLADDASDPESDSLTFAKLSGPAWLDVAADGTLTGTPGPADVGLNTFSVQVSDAGSSDSTTLQITVVAETFTLSYTAGPNGSINGTSPQGVQYGADGSAVTAIPDPGYHFVNWSDGLTVNPRIDSTVTADINVTANFEIDTFTLSYTAGPNGSISGPSSQVVEYGTDGSAVTALADSGYHFVNWSDGSTDNPRTDTGVMGNVAVTANFEVDPPLSDLAGAEITLLGTISAGTITDTHTSDNTYQILTETESGGKRNRRRSQLEHKWIFDVTGGELVTFFVEAHHTVNAEGDHFVFSYSTDDINYTDMLTVTKTADDDSSNFFVLPGDLSGTVYVRVVDTDRTQGNRALDSLYVDSLSIVSESASEAPTGATDPNPIDGISHVSVNTVLSWTPSLLAASNNVYFGLNPTPGAAEFQLNQTTNSFEPGPLEYNTTYYWAIDEVNSAGTAYGPVWSFTTGGAIPEMHVSSIEPGVQRKGKSYHGVVIVSVVDSTSGQAVVGATVQGVFSGVFNQSLSAVTDSSGRAVLTTSAKERLPFSYTFTVTEVNATNYLYQPANNIETSDSGSF